MATQAITKLPHGVGHWSRGWLLVAAVALGLLGLGAYAYSRQFTEGEIVTGMRDIGTMGGAAWGLYVGFVVYFVGVSFAGITIAAMIRLMNLERLKPIARIAEVVTVVTLILAAFTILPDLGQPGRGIANLFLYARPQSPFFGTFALVIAGYLFASLVYLYLDGRKDAALCAKRSNGWLRGFHRLWAAGYKDTPEEQERHHRTSFWLALAILPLLVTAHSTLGFVFGLQVGRPGWFSALQAPGFVVMAGVSGIGILIVIAAVLRRALGIQAQLNLDTFKWLSNLMMVLTVTYLYFVIVEWLTSAYTAHHHEQGIFTSLFTGQYAWLYWLSISLLVVPFILGFIQFAVRRYSLYLIVLSAVLVNLAAIGKRYLIVVPSQTHGALLPYETGNYAPSWVEYSVILGIIGLGILLFIGFAKIFPIMHVKEGTQGG